jgi:hypothetical protein
MELYDHEGQPIEIPDEMVKIQCFFCTNYLETKGGLLLSPPEKSFGDGVDKIDEMHLCKSCFELVMNFIMGKVNQIEIMPKLHLISDALEKNRMTSAMRLTGELMELVKKGGVKTS